MMEYGCKVCRVLDERNMDQYEARLLEQWEADPPRRKGYRQLAEWLNITMLRREMDRAGLSTLGNEAESKYERLQRKDAIADEVAEGLTHSGIDIGSLTDDFVSYGVVRTHLKDCLNAQRERITSEWERDAIAITEEHAHKKISTAIGSLQNKGKLSAGGDITLEIAIQLECENCHTRIPLDRAVRRGAVCNCG